MTSDIIGASTATARLPWADEYPFINYRFNLKAVPTQTWALLGECSSKIEHVMGTPLRADAAEELNTVFLVKGIHGTTAIEGNTLSEDQVKDRVKGQLTLQPTQEYLGREIDNIMRAYNHLAEQLRQGVPLHLAPEDLRNLNRMVLEGLELEPSVVPGEYREGRVVVSDYRSPPREHLEQMVGLGCVALNDEKWSTQLGGKFIIPILRSIFSHLYIAWIHPFGDGNGRTARLIEFDLLIRAGVPIACAHVLSDYYNRTRSRYYRALSMARKDPMHFVCYAVEGLREMLLEQIGVIQSLQLEVTWQNYVYGIFRKDEDTASARRQREIALELGRVLKAVHSEDISSLSPKLTRMYHGKTVRTLQRDLRALRGRDLIRFKKDGIRAHLGLVRAFLPEKGAALPTNAETERNGGKKNTQGR